MAWYRPSGSVVSADTPQFKVDKGKLVTIEDSVKGYAEVEFTENLIPYPYYESEHTTRGITYTANSDGSVNINGTREEGAIYWRIRRATEFALPAGTYTIGGEGFGATPSVSVRLSDGTTIASTWSAYAPNTFTLTEETPLEIQIFASGETGATVNTTVKPMLVKGSTAPSGYIPYNAEITACGKNLAVLSDNLNTTRPYAFEDSSNGTITVKADLKPDWFILGYVYLEKDTWYTLSADLGYGRLTININDVPPQLYDSTPYSNIIKNESGYYSIAWCSDASNSNAKKPAFSTSIQIEKGLVATEYEPYKSKSFTSTTSPIVVETYDGLTNIFSNGDIDLTVKRAKNEVGGKFTEVIRGKVITGENLLLNSDFRINQRGKSEYSGAQMGADHWLQYLANGVVKITDDGLWYQNCFLRQNFFDIEHLKGKTLTYSLEATCDVEQGSSIALFDTVAQAQTMLLKGRNYYEQHMTISNDATRLEFIFADEPWGKNAKTKVHWAKLEIGNIATPYVHPDPKEELLKCQKYYFMLKDFSQYEVVGKGTAYNNYYTDVKIPLPTPMRALPSFDSVNSSPYNSWCFEYNTNNSRQICNAVPTVQSMTDDYVVLRFSHPSISTSYLRLLEPYLDGASIGLSAEL